MQKCAFLLDPLDKLKPYKDSSIALMLEAQERGVEVYAGEFSDLSIEEGRVYLTAPKVTLSAEAARHKKVEPSTYQLSEKQRTPLDEMGAVFTRKDPPFGSDYFSLTQILSAHRGRVAFVNDPAGLREISEKLVATRFPEFTPKTLVTYSLEEARAFAARHGGVVIKPAYFGAGDGVKKSAATDADFADIFQGVLDTEPHGPAILQEFLPEVAKGDTRVMIINGRVEGAVGRQPAEGEFRANIAAGGSEVAAELTERQQEICAVIGPYLTQHGVRFAGADFIGDYLIEINVTSPTLIQELKRVGGPDIAKVIWDGLA